MCVIIHQPKGTHLEKERAKRLWAYNPDGGGFAYITDDEEIQVEKFMEFNDFWTGFEQARSANADRDYILHMRIGTHGTTDLNNVHPFVVDRHTVMAHNGIIHGVPEYNDGRSDTAVFVDEVLSELPIAWLDSYYINEMLGGWIDWSRLVFLTNDPELVKNVYILNKEKGHTVEGMWFSNMTAVHKPWPKQTHTSSASAKWDRKGHMKDGVWYPPEPQTYPGKGEAYNKSAINLARLRSAQKEHGILHPGETGGTGTLKAIVDMDSEEFTAWLADRYGEDSWEYRRGVAEIGKEIESIDHEILQSVRESSKLEMPFLYNPVTDTWECLGCDEEMDQLTGECECWIKICIDCEEFAAQCKCSLGYSTNLELVAALPNALVHKINAKITSAE